MNESFDFELKEHWTQGEFHHDLIFELTDDCGIDGNYLVISTNCNGGIKDVMSFGSFPDRWALWNYRCPENEEFSGTCKPLEVVRTAHWFNPCELLKDDARSEYRAEVRQRQRGGGWEPA